MLTTLLGSLFGGFFRLAPELFKFLDAKADRAHELAMFDKQLEADKQKGAQALEQINAQAAATISADELQALIEATKAQAVQTGVKWVDAISSLMRPLLTFWWAIVLYTVALGAEFYTLVYVSHVPLVNAVLQLWGVDEKAIVASIVAFWFVDRSLRKK